MINIDLLKKIRQETQVPIADIREALEAAKGNEKKAREFLKEKGLGRAESKAERKTTAGLVESYIHANGASGAVVVLACETDFVARTEEFKKLAHELAMQVCAMEPKTLDELLNQPWIRDEAKKIEDLIKEQIAKLGENITIKNFARFAV